jgi:hypothetical protein
MGEAPWRSKYSSRNVRRLLGITPCEPTVLDHSRTLPQGDGCARPAFTRRAVGGECNLIILDAGDVLFRRQGSRYRRGR